MSLCSTFVDLLHVQILTGEIYKDEKSDMCHGKHAGSWRDWHIKKIRKIKVWSEEEGGDGEAGRQTPSAQGRSEARAKSKKRGQLVLQRAEAAWDGNTQRTLCVERPEWHQ